MITLGEIQHRAALPHFAWCRLPDRVNKRNMSRRVESQKRRPPNGRAEALPSAGFTEPRSIRRMPIRRFHWHPMTIDHPCLDGLELIVPRSRLHCEASHLGV